MADLTVCGIPLEYFPSDHGRHRYLAHRGVNVTMVRERWKDPDLRHWWLRFETGGVMVTLTHDEDDPVAAARALEAAVLKDFGHKLALMRWLLEQKP